MKQLSSKTKSKNKMKNKLAIFATLLLVFSCAKSTSQEETDDESIRNILTLLSNAIENDDLQVSTNSMFVVNIATKL